MIDMSALPPKADMCSAVANVASGQKRTSVLFDHLIRTRLHRRRHVDAERLGCLQIDVELYFGGLLDRQVGGFFALENPTDVIAREAVCLSKVRSIAQQTSGHGEVAALVDRWHHMAERQRGKLFNP